MQFFIRSVAVLCVIVLTTPVYAVLDNPNQLGVVTGSVTGTYIKFGQDMAKAAEGAGVSVLVKESEGSLANIRRLISKENAAAGIVQSDVLGFLTRSTNERMRSVASRLRLIFPFYNEEVHLYARKNINSFTDLQGKRIVVGTKGSGNWLTSTNLLHMMGIEAGEQLYLAPAAGATAVLTDQADAMFYVAGKPVKLFTSMEQFEEIPKYRDLAKEVHMVPLDDPKMLKEYLPASLGPSDYSWIETDTPTIAVKAVLVGFDFTAKKSAYYKKRCKEIGLLSDAIRANLGQLKNSGHPKWQEVDLDAEIGLWEKNQCAITQQVGTRKTSPQADDFLTRELEKCIQTGVCK